ncbi:glutamate--cysteine ligase [Alteromonas pelagimontana]|uniref:glutamate--cysteine ligase n=1 Tax=Alteromonas pelagimontana TaxID=1858656 RepID=UPI00094FD255|nr:glutamate--cysteine ligase [Alteromonas pelagimontana]
MTSTELSFSQRVAALDTPEFLQTLTQIKRGVEREGLRIQSNGKLATTPHSPALGAALTHESITTDYSEVLLEFITPPETDANVTIEQLQDIHKFVMSHIDGEKLWPMSMPCFIDDENDIPVAYFGESNVGKMKRIYRLGLKNRYGSMMQAIAGVHYNFSFPLDFWQQWDALHGSPHNQDQISADYLALVRNYRRLCWLIPYLYGASPALCSSFLKGKTHKLPFKKVGKGTYYLPYATSLRMSDLGYTNAEQSALHICYNQLDNYVNLLRTAMNTESSTYKKFSAGKDGNYQQLSPNILQIENELYSPIRPKQPTASMEKPTDALVRRGVSYIEVRALDVNPFTPVGISRDQMDFLDVFLLTCLLIPSKTLDAEQLMEANENLTSIVLEGRKPHLQLKKDGQPIAMHTWTERLFDELAQAAKLLDKAHASSRYSAAVTREWAKIKDPELTPSGQILSALRKDNADNSAFGLLLAKEYTDAFANFPYTHQSAEDFETMAKASLEAQRTIEANDDKDFDTFIRAYYNEPPAKKMPD